MAKTIELRMAIDIGGTFTDTVLMDEASKIIATTKTPTTAANPELGALEGASRLLTRAQASMEQITGLVHGTTLATNALIERRGARVSTVTTSGFRDILEIAYERRYSQYAINLVKPDLIVPRSRAFTIGGRMDASGLERSPFDEEDVEGLIGNLVATNTEAVAICLLHSYANPAHELRLREILRARLPNLVISLSHEISPEAREFDRLCTTIANAYVQPLMSKYLANLEREFAACGFGSSILMVTAGGGMTTLETAARLPIRLVESGPAGGAVLAARIARECDARNVLSFDMGGTTAKLCLIDEFRPQTARKFEISRADRFKKGSGMPVRIPVVEMIEIGAGGGSIASVDRLGRVQVGPESAGADPGPAAFGRGGKEPTVTDADIIQGYIEPARFAEGRLKVDIDAADASLKKNLGKHLNIDAVQSGYAVSEIVDENMASAGRMHAVESGKELDTRLMIAFGGNGPLHATRLARKINVKKILIPKDPGVGSAVGFLYAPVSFEVVRSKYSLLRDLDLYELNHFLVEMKREAEEVVRAGAPDAPFASRRVAFMRYHGQGHEIEVELPDGELTDDDLTELRFAFEAEYQRQFSRVVPGMTIEILNWGLTVSTPAPMIDRASQLEAAQSIYASETREILCDVTGEICKAGIFDRANLKSGDRVIGPALIIEPQTTTLVSRDFQASIDANQNIVLTKLKEVHA